MKTILSILAAFMVAPNILAQERGAPPPVALPDRASIRLAPATERAFDRSGLRVSRRTLPNGSQVADHNGTMQNVTVARVGEDGTIETFCTTEQEAALDFLSGLDKAGGQASKLAAPGARR